MIIGSGCTVPGIMSTRTMDNRKDRMITLLITPFISCGAKLPIYLVFIAAFFPSYGGLVLFLLYAFGIFVALVMAKVFNQTMFRGESSYFIMEMPPYRIPTVKNVLRNMWDNVSGFIKKAGTIIFLVITLLWVLAVLPTSVEPYSEFSLLGRIGAFLAPIFRPAGFGTWQEAVALFAGIPAKEAVVGTLGAVRRTVSEEGMIRRRHPSALYAHRAVHDDGAALHRAPYARHRGQGDEVGPLAGLYGAVHVAIGWLVAVIVYQVEACLSGDSDGTELNA